MTIKLYVVFVGLLMVWQDPVNKRGLVLLRKALDEYVGGMPVPPHQAIVEYRDLSGQVKPVPIDGLDLSFVVNSSENFQVDDPGKKFLDFGELFRLVGASSEAVADTCKAGLSQCRKYLAGRAVLSNGVLRPVQVWKDSGTGELMARTEIYNSVFARYRPTTGDRKQDFAMKYVANGVRLDVSLSAVDVKLRIGSGQESLGQASAGDLKRINVTQGPKDISYIIWVENLPPYISASGRVADSHFYLLYDFFSQSDIARWVPVVDLVLDRPVPPGSQCITPIFVK